MPACLHLQLQARAHDAPRPRPSLRQSRDRERDTHTPTLAPATCNLHLHLSSPSSPAQAQAQPYPAYLPALRRLSRKHTPPLRFPRPHPYPYRIHMASVADAADSIRVRQTEHLRPTSSASQASQAIYLGALRACSPGTTVRAGSPRALVGCGARRSPSAVTCS
jgi:hypothetical protein